jgi:hypothetical protein
MPDVEQQPSLQQSRQDSAFAGAHLPSRVNTVRKNGGQFQ